MSDSNPARTEPTSIAGRFEVVKKLGAGAFGTVYKAKDKVLGRMLAIKTIRLEGLAASQTGLQEMLDRFQREARVAAQLKHPNIVTIYDIGESDGLSYISMEFIDGVGLDQVIAQSGRLTTERAAALAAQVADGLDYAHRHGVVHRDIKPANIMIEPGDRVKVTDFGIAKPGDSAEHLTMTGSLLGTPSYMSPEQARGQKLDGRSDLFSLGCVLYEMLAGRKAFRGESITALLFKIITEEPPALRELDPSVPDGMLKVLEKVLAKAPEGRYQTGREMADDLLALTQPSAMPTLRAVDAPTLPPEPAPTLAAAPTLARATLSSATQPQPPSGATQPPTPPPVPPTVARTPAGAEPPVAPTVVAPPPRPRTAAARTEAPARGGPGPLLVLAVLGLGLFFVLALGAGGWWLYSHRATEDVVTMPSPEPSALPSTQPSPESDLEPTPATEETTSPEAAPSILPTATTAPSAPDPTPTPSTPRSANTNPPNQPSRPRADVPPAGDFSFLNDIPAQGPDGRELGENAARAYRSGGGSGGVAGRRFAARPRVPRDLAPAERPAAATLLHVAFAQQAYHRSNGRYGSLRELKTAGLLRLDVPFQEGTFERARYRFELQGGSADYRLNAIPLFAGGRPFYTDDNGFVLVDE